MPRSIERVADRGHLPIQNGDDPRQVLGIEHEVVVLVVVVDERGVRFRRHVVGQPLRDSIHLRERIGLGVGVAIDPARHLARDVPFRFSQVGQTGRLVVQRVQESQIVDQCRAEPACRRRVDGQAGVVGTAQDDPPPAFHDVERDAENAGVLAVEVGAGGPGGRRRSAWTGRETRAPCRGPS